MDLNDAFKEIQDPTGETELGMRDVISALEDVLREFLVDTPGITTGEIALAYGTLFPESVLAWGLAILLRDRVEFGARAEA